MNLLISRPTFSLFSKDEQTVFQFLQSKGDSPIQQKEVKALQLTTSHKVGVFAATLFKLFGAQHATQVAKKLDEPLQKAFFATWESHNELLNKSHITPYSKEVFQKTAELIQTYFKNANPDTVFKALRRDALSMLSFNQTLSTWDLVPKEASDENLLERRIAMTELDAVARSQESVDYKGEVSSQSIQNQMALARLTHVRGALALAGETKSTTFTYADLLATWKPDMAERLSQATGLTKWGDVGKGKGIEKFRGIADKQLHWRAFLAECTVQMMEENFRLVLPASFKSRLIDSLASNEYLRSDVAYFTGFPDIFLEFRNPWPSDFSAPLLSSLQLFLYLVRHHAISQERQGELLGMIFSKENHVYSIEAIEEGTWQGFSADEQAQWKNFLASCAMERIERQFGCKLPAITRKILFSTFVDYESVRSAVTDFVNQPQGFWDSSEPLAARILGALRDLRSMVQKYEISQEKRGPLLVMIFSKDPGMSIDELGDRSQEEVQNAWNCFEVILSSLKQKSISAAEAEELLREQGALSFFFFLMGHPDQQNRWAAFFAALSQTKKVNLTLDLIQKFCFENRECSPQQFEDFCTSYIKLIDTVTKKWPDLRFETIFLSPPLQISEETLKQVTAAPRHVDNLLVHLTSYHITQPTFFTLLMQILARPDLLRIFELLKEDGLALGLSQVDDRSLNLFFSYPETLFPFDPACRKGAIAFVNRLQSFYRFKDQQRFSLYLKVLFLFTYGERESLRKSSHVVARLEEFIPSLNPMVVYFVYRYSLDPPLELMKKLHEKYLGQLQRDIQLEEALISKVETDLGCSRLPSQESPEIQLAVKEFIEGIEIAIPDEDERQVFSRNLETVLHYLFYPVSQPVSDALQIADLDPISGPVSHEAHVETHVGKEIPLSDLNSRSIYTKWEVGPGGHPLFFFMVRDQQKAISRSAFVSFDDTLEQIHALPDGGKAFFSLMRDLAPSVLIYDRFLNQQQILNTIKGYEIQVPKEAVLHIWKFLLKVKIGLAKCYTLDAQDPSFGIGTNFTPLLAAAQGHIFRSKKGSGGSLLPEFLQVEADPKFYTSNISFKIARMMMPIFKVVEPRMQRLNGVFLSVVDSGEREMQLPLYSSVNEAGVISLGYPVSTFDGGASIGDRPVQVPLFYAREVREDPVSFWQRLQDHLLLVKADCYQRLALKELSLPDSIIVPSSQGRAWDPTDGDGVDEKSD